MNENFEPINISIEFTGEGLSEDQKLVIYGALQREIRQALQKIEYSINRLAYTMKYATNLRERE